MMLMMIMMTDDDDNDDYDDDDNKINLTNEVWFWRLGINMWLRKRIRSPLVCF